jgi:hypothetical protein
MLEIISSKDSICESAVFEKIFSSSSLSEDLKIGTHCVHVACHLKRYDALALITF